MARCGLLGRQEDVAGDALDGPLGDQEAVAVAMHLQAADGKFAAARGDGVVAGAQLDQVAAGDQTGQRGLQVRAAVALGPQFADQLLEISFGVRKTGDVVEQVPVGHSLILCDAFCCWRWRRPFMRPASNTWWWTMPKEIPRKTESHRLCHMRRLILLLVPAALLAGQPRYARLADFTGTAEVQLEAAADWMPAERNLPLAESAWLRTGAESRLEIELDEGSAWRLGPESQCALADYTRLSTGQRVTLLWLDRGLAYLTGAPEGRDALTVALPGAQVILTHSASVRLEVREAWTRISVLSGVARFSSPAAELDLREGQTTRVEPANPARFFLDREIAPLELDRWSEARDKALASPASAVHVLERYGLTLTGFTGLFFVNGVLLP